MFSLVIGPDLVSEWKAKNGKNVFKGSVPVPFFASGDHVLTIRRTDAGSDEANLSAEDAANRDFRSGRVRARIRLSAIIW